MTKPYNFAADAALPKGIGEMMQRAADRRASDGLISADGTTHNNRKAMAIYDRGVSPLSKEYLDAAFPA